MRCGAFSFLVVGAGVQFFAAKRLFLQAIALQQRKRKGRRPHMAPEMLFRGSRVMKGCISSWWVTVLLAPVVAGAAPPPQVTISRPLFRDRVYACFLGKSIGGTLGMPVEGQRETHAFTFFDPVPTEPAANDDLDLQLLWLKAVQERGPGLTCLDLGEYWLKYVPVDWNEYGVGKANMRDGFLPPVSGHFRNERWRDSNGAWIRSEIWACLAPGCPALAAQYAFEDACVDHGVAEGTYAEMFVAAVEAAAFVEADRERLISIGLSYIPPDCAVARSVRAALDAHRRGLDLYAAREEVVRASASTGWFMAPQNVAFVILGWLYGDGDFGRSICAAVNCGDDTDCTGATLGSILGILGGTAAIPAEWRAPVGDAIRTIAVAGFQPPAMVSDLADEVIQATPLVLRHHGVAVELTEASMGAPVATKGIPLRDTRAARALWSRSPWQVRYRLPEVEVALDYGCAPMITAGEPRRLSLRMTNNSSRSLGVGVVWKTSAGLSARPSSWSGTLPPAIDGAGMGGNVTRYGRGVGLGAGNVEQGKPVICSVSLVASEPGERLHRGWAEIRVSGRGQCLLVPFSLLGAVAVHASDLALASKGAKATSDSELDWEGGCTARAIDGVIASPQDFEGKRWHSALTPHPHWICVELPAPAEASRVIVHFADPAGHPVDFDGEASLDGQNWAMIFQERGYTNPRRFEADLPRTTLRFFRLTIRRSASRQWPDAAQVSEIELLPP